MCICLYLMTNMPHQTEHHIFMKNMIMAGIVTKFMEVTLPEDMLMEVAA